MLKKLGFLNETRTANLPSAPWAGDFYTRHSYAAGKTVESLAADSRSRSCFFPELSPPSPHSPRSVSFSASCHLQPVFLHIMRRLILCLESYLDLDQTPLQLVSWIRHYPSTGPPAKFSYTFDMIYWPDQTLALLRYALFLKNKVSEKSYGI